MKLTILLCSLLFAAIAAKDSAPKIKRGSGTIVAKDVYVEGATTVDSPGAAAADPAAQLGVNETASYMYFEDAYLVDHAQRFLQLKIGETTTLAGSSKGFNDGVGTSAQFFKPTGVAFDPDGDFLLVAVRAWPASPRRALLRASTTQSSEFTH